VDIVSTLRNTKKAAPTAIGPQPSRSWAQVAAGGPTGRQPQPPIVSRPDEEVTIRPNDLNTKLRDQTTARGILETLQPNMSRAGLVAARRLRSGDIRLTVQNKKHVVTNRDSIQHQINAQILPEVFPVEVLAVPKTLAVQAGPKADNGALLRALAKENDRLLPDVSFTKVHWIRQYPQAKDTPLKTRTSLILATSSAHHQQELVRQGVLIEGAFYQARLYDYGHILDRCYHCNRWGHSRTHCRQKEPTCGHCGKGHDTGDCKDTAQRYCASCKSHTHKAWMAASCPVFRKLYEERSQRRYNLLQRSDAIRANQGPLRGYTPGLTPSPEDEAAFNTKQAGEKRPRAPSPAPTQKKAAPGRPRAIDPRYRPANQTTLALVRAPTPAETLVESTQTGPTQGEAMQIEDWSDTQETWMDDTPAPTQQL
jgi:hypothetical protein